MKTQTRRSKQKVLSFLSEQKLPQSTLAVSKGTGITPKAASVQLSRLTAAGAIKRVGRGVFTSKEGKGVGTVRSTKTTTTRTTAAQDVGVAGIQTKLAELSQERAEIDGKISALETTLQLLGYRPRKTRGAITDRQWLTIGRKANP